MSTRPDFNRDSIAGDVVKAFPEQIGGKTIIITGPSNASLGSAVATALAGSSQPPAQLVFAGRSLEKIFPVIENINSINPSIKTTFVKLELDSLSSVRTAAKEVLSSVEKIDILINNAGIMYLPTYTTTEAGVEMQFGVNHLGHWLLTVLLLRNPIGKGMSVVNVSSLGYELAEFGDPNWDNGKKYSGWGAYGLSKTANILFSLALKERGVRSIAAHPGLVLETSIFRVVTEEAFAEGSEMAKRRNNGTADLEPKTFEQGASTIVAAAIDPALTQDPSCILVVNCTSADVRDYAKDKKEAQRLWEISEKFVGEKFDI